MILALTSDFIKDYLYNLILVNVTILLHEPASSLDFPVHHWRGRFLQGNTLDLLVAAQECGLLKYKTHLSNFFQSK